MRADDGAPIQGADVRSQHRDAAEFWNFDLEYGAKVDELGAFRIEVPPDFRGEIGVMDVRHETVRASAKDVVAGQTGLVLTLPDSR